MDEVKIDTDRIHREFTEIVALRLDVFEQRVHGIWPPDTDLDRHRRRYLGIPEKDLPPNIIVINHFKREVDSFVSMLMQSINNNL